MCEAGGLAKIAHLNDEFRNVGGGLIVLTAGIAAPPAPTTALILDAVARFRCPDPLSEHQIGTLTVEGRGVIWYIRYHRRDGDERLEIDPANPKTTKRVLVTLAQEP